MDRSNTRSDKKTSTSDVLTLIHDAQQKVESLRHVADLVDKCIEQLDDIKEDLPDELELETLIEDLQAAYIDLSNNL